MFGYNFFGSSGFGSMVTWMWMIVDKVTTSWNAIAKISTSWTSEMKW